MRHLIVFLDDIRPLPDHLQNVQHANVALCRTADEFCRIIVLCYKPGDTLDLYLDHDLGDFDTHTGEEVTGASCLRWFITSVLYNHIDKNPYTRINGSLSWINLIRVHCHSSNPVGKENILALWDSFKTALTKWGCIDA